MPGIDSHAHVFSASAPAIAGSRYRPAYAATLSDWRSRWPKGGITHGVVVQPSFFGTDNAEALAAVASDPERLRAVVVLDPDVADETLASLAAAGACALRLNLVRSALDYSVFGESAWRAFFLRLERIGWHLETYVETGRLPEIAAALGRSTIPVVFDHFGNPGPSLASQGATFQAVASLVSARPVWVKFSGPYRLGGADPVALAARWIETVGERQVVWGSDWPWTNHETVNDYGRLREALDAWVGPARSRAILWDNAARLYGFA